MARARVGENNLPKFDFTIKIMELYCFVDKEEVVIEGGDDRVN